MIWLVIVGGNVVVDVAVVIVEVDAVAADAVVVPVVTVGGKVVVDVVVVMVEVGAVVAVVLVAIVGCKVVVDVAVAMVEVDAVVVAGVLVEGSKSVMVVSLLVTVKLAGFLALPGLTVSILLVVCFGTLRGMAFVALFGRFLAENVMVAIREVSLCVLLL